MPRRITPLVNGEFYHIFNRGVNRQPVFLNKRDYQRLLELTKFYNLVDYPIRYSKFLLLAKEERKKFFETMKNADRLVKIVCFCFMPNHFHFLLRQEKDSGISNFIRNLQISYVRFFNVKHERIGPLFQGQFKAVRIEGEEQLVHVSRYIHLNPFTSFVVKEIEQLEDYRWSSFLDYTGKSKSNVCDTGPVFSLFPTRKSYKEFVYNQADYQKDLGGIKHLVFD